MASSTLRIIILVVFIMHGIGHLMGLLAALGIKLSPNHSTVSWLLSNVLGTNIERILCSIFSIAASILFVAAAFGMMNWFGLHANWQTLALYAAWISLIGLVLFWNSYPFFIPNKAGVILLDVLTITGILWTDWPQKLLR